MEFKKEQEITESRNSRENVDKQELLKEFTKSMIILMVFFAFNVIGILKYQEATLFLINGFKGVDWHATGVVLLANFLLVISTVSAIISY